LPSEKPKIADATAVTYLGDDEGEGSESKKVHLVEQ
jgi:hypothetical protein